MASYATIPDQRVVELQERAHRERRLAAVLEHDNPGLKDWNIVHRRNRHLANALRYEQQAKELQA